jgi:hypothetical protein
MSKQNDATASLAPEGKDSTGLGIIKTQTYRGEDTVRNAAGEAAAKAAQAIAAVRIPDPGPTGRGEYKLPLNESA